MLAGAREWSPFLMKGWLGGHGLVCFRRSLPVKDRDQKRQDDQRDKPRECLSQGNQPRRHPSSHHRLCLVHLSGAHPLGFHRVKLALKECVYRSWVDDRKIEVVEDSSQQHANERREHPNAYGGSVAPGAAWERIGALLSHGKSQGRDRNGGRARQADP